jgi:hypothetical protein
MKNNFFGKTAIFLFGVGMMLLYCVLPLLLETLKKVLDKAREKCYNN